MEQFAELPDECISEIVSFTSPVDASVFSIVSKRFKVLSESDIVWEKFIPSDIEDYISRSSSFIPVFPIKKDLFLFLSNSPILLDGEKMSFSLDKKTGKKCFMVDPRDFTFVGLNHPNCFLSVPEEASRFAEIAVLHLLEYMHDICGRINCRMLSEETQYASYLVYKVVPTHNDYCIPPLKGVCRFVENESREEAKERASLVSLDVQGDKDNFIDVPRNRSDGWKEVEIGSFFNVRRNSDNVGEVESIVFATVDLPMYFGIIVQGIEFRPKIIV